ncbi:MAG TPA: FG-GAP-like repeat-containing protein [Terriglobia bacterium]|nr:FG-GAP-like repeat-containing protein [Terriglobia bacterium]
MVHPRKAVTLIFGLAIIFSFSARVYAQFFENRGSSPVELYPNFVAAGDLNHDGKQDMVATAFISNKIEVLLGNGDGTFQPGVYYAVGAEPSSIVVADFNNDGKLDLAVAEDVSASIGILLGNGDGTFQADKEMPIGVCPTQMKAGDFNGDHILDLVAVVDTVSQGVQFGVLLGNGDGTFQPPIITQAPITPFAIGVGDFNRDGKLDVATAGQFLGTSEATIFLGNGDGTFKQGQSYPVGSSPSSIAVGDFRSIGKLDLAVADFQGAGVSVLLGNGDGTFQPAVNYDTIFPESVATGDFNRDGKLDLVAANYGYSGGRAGATVFVGKGDGTFQAGLFYPTGQNDLFVAVADFNNDAWPDLALADRGGKAIVLLNTGAVSFSPTTPLQFLRQLVNTTSNPQTVTLTNTGATALSIGSISIQGSGFQLNGGTTCGTSVPPSGSCNIAVTFQPTTEGSKAGLVLIVDSASKKPQVIELLGSGTVVSLSPAQLSFPPTKVGSKSAPQTITLTNTGSTTLNITSVGLGGQDPTFYSETNTCGTQVGPGGTCTISVTFAPQDKGAFPATATVSDDGGGSPQIVTLTGTGT